MAGGAKAPNASSLQSDTPCSCRAFPCPPSHNHSEQLLKNSSIPGVTAASFTGTQQLVFEPNPSERLEKLLQQTLGRSAEAGKGQPALTFHGTALGEGSIHPSLPLAAPLEPPAPPAWRNPLPAAASACGLQHRGLVRLRKS